MHISMKAANKAISPCLDKTTFSTLSYSANIGSTLRDQNTQQFLLLYLPDLGRSGLHQRWWSSNQGIELKSI